MTFDFDRLSFAIIGNICVKFFSDLKPVILGTVFIANNKISGNI
uniref:Uncharacterized protein n=1 Tax=Triticum urartu TaxID=4572 RepID=A0A8R7JZF3_TRIUA